MKCPSCNREIATNSTFCQHCGERITVLLELAQKAVISKESNRAGKVVLITLILFALIIVAFVYAANNLNDTTTPSFAYSDDDNDIAGENESIISEEPIVAEKTQAEIRALLRIKKVRIVEINSAGGVDFSIEWINNSDKTIKYITFTAIPYNAVDDVVECDIKRTSRYRGQCTGPYEQGKGMSEADGYWKNAWWNNTVKKVALTAVEIEYMDGAKIELTGPETQKAFY